MLEIPALIKPLFRAAGWQGPRVETLLNASGASAYAIASQIVGEFGGLTVGTCGPGTENAASDVCFYERIRPKYGEVFQEWGQQIGEVVPFASAHRHHIILAVGDNGQFYVYTDPDDRLYAGPHDFGELMRCLLWGYSYGTTIPKDIR